MGKGVRRRVSVQTLTFDEKVGEAALSQCRMREPPLQAVTDDQCVSYPQRHKVSSIEKWASCDALWGVLSDWPPSGRATQLKMASSKILRDDTVTRLAQMSKVLRGSESVRPQSR